MRRVDDALHSEAVRYVIAITQCSRVSRNLATLKGAIPKLRSGIFAVVIYASIRMKIELRAAIYEA